MFGKEDLQSEAFVKAADKGGYKHTIVKTADAAFESYLANQQDLVIIDCRHSKILDHESICRFVPWSVQTLTRCSPAVVVTVGS